MLLDIPQFEGRYAITEFGIIHSLTRKTGLRIFQGKILKQKLDKYGYSTVSLCLGSRELGNTTQLIHRLVAIVFIPNPLNLPCINHKDGKKENNHKDNLEWCTWQENTNHAWQFGLCTTYDRSQNYNRAGIQNSNRRRRKYVFNQEQIEYMKQMHKDGFTQAQIASVYETKQGTISQILRGINCGI